MSIRDIARELYRLDREVEELEVRLQASPAEKRAELEEHLRKTKAERNRVARILDGKKEPPPYRKPKR
jgi:hypothetical protein